MKRKLLPFFLSIIMLFNFLALTVACYPNSDNDFNPKYGWPPSNQEFLPVWEEFYNNSIKNTSDAISSVNDDFSNNYQNQINRYKDIVSFGEIILSSIAKNDLYKYNTDNDFRINWNISKKDSIPDPKKIKNSQKLKIISKDKDIDNITKEEKDFSNYIESISSDNDNKKTNKPSVSTKPSLDSVLGKYIKQGDFAKMIASPTYSDVIDIINSLIPKDLIIDFKKINFTIDPTNDGLSGKIELTPIKDSLYSENTFFIPYTLLPSISTVINEKITDNDYDNILSTPTESQIREKIKKVIPTLDLDYISIKIIEDNDDGGRDQYNVANKETNNFLKKTEIYSENLKRYALNSLKSIYIEYSINSIKNVNSYRTDDMYFMWAAKYMNTIRMYETYTTWIQQYLQFSSIAYAINFSGVFGKFIPTDDNGDPKWSLPPNIMNICDKDMYNSNLTWGQWNSQNPKPGDYIAFQFDSSLKTSIDNVYKFILKFA